MNTLLILGASAGPELLAQVVTIIVAFVLTIAILYAFAWKPVLALLDARKNEIVRSFEDIDRKVADAQALIKDYEERIRRIDEEARERMNKAIDEGRRVASDMIEKARLDSEEIAAKARQSMEMELGQARMQLRRDVVEMTLEATGRLLQVKVDDDRSRQLVNEFIADVDARRSAT
jgi:F-type H+-transporting ATPase subunit b